MDGRPPPPAGTEPGVQVDSSVACCSRPCSWPLSWRFVRQCWSTTVNTAWKGYPTARIGRSHIRPRHRRRLRRRSVNYAGSIHGGAAAHRVRAAGRPARQQPRRPRHRRAEDPRRYPPRRGHPRRRGRRHPSASTMRTNSSPKSPGPRPSRSPDSRSANPSFPEEHNDDRVRMAGRLSAGATAAGYRTPS